MNALMNLARSPLAGAIGWSLLHFFWQGALIAAVAAVALRIARAARWRYAIACLSLFSMPLVFGITLWLMVPQAPVRPASSFISRFGPSTPPLIPPHGEVAQDFAAYLQWAAPLWLAGVLCVIFYRAAAWIFARRLRRLGTCAAPAEWIARIQTLAAGIGVTRPVLLLESALAEVPMMIGYLRPVILLPLGMLAGLSADQVEAILLHELAHIARADYLVSLLQTAVEALLFYHPAVWWISGVIRNERENCCDDVVLAAQADPHAYATALVTIEQNRVRATEPALAATDGDLLRRVRRVLRTADARESSVPLIPAVAVLLALAIGFARAQAPSAPQTAMSSAYEKWLNEDVVYIITDVEREGFKKLTTDEDREAFIKDFWLFRDPTPGTPENEFKEEHYRRIAYANTRFKSGIPGWKTDRGRIYIQYGPPDEIESHPSGSDQKPYPFEQWLYRLIAGIGTNVIVEFDDKDRTGEFRMTMDPNPQGGTPAPGPPARGGTRHFGARETSPGGVTLSAEPGYEMLSFRATNSSGFVAAWLDQTIVKGGLKTFSVKLAPGSYVISAVVKDLQTAATHSESVNVEVK